MDDSGFSIWHHSPPHLFVPNCSYIISARTMDRTHHFRRSEDLAVLQSIVFEAATRFQWHIEAWAFFSNHYHLIAVSPENALSLSKFVGRIHSRSADYANQRDGAKGRQVWFRFRDTCLTYEESYYARRNYVNNNPVRHGLVKRASLYPYCSATWFEQCVEGPYAKKVASFKYDKVSIEDDYECIWE